MRKINSILGYTFAFLCIPIFLTGIIGLDFWGGKLVEITGVSVSPWYTGGSIIKTISHGEYNIDIHRAVFDGLFTERKKGFVQIDFSPLDSLPESIEEKIDYDDDGNIDFKVLIDTKNCTAEIESCNENVVSLEGCYKLTHSIAVKVVLKNNK